MSVFDSIILGIVEGITEFLPVSSTGHLILAGHLLGVPNSEFLKSFEIAIQLGAICAVLVLYWKSFLSSKMLKKLFVAFVPTAIIGVTFYSFIKTHLLGNDEVVIWALALGGIFIILFEYFHKEKEMGLKVDDITYKQAFLVGLFQAIAIVPGVSRSAATIIGGLFLGIKRSTIVTFSFLLAVPTLGAATGLELVKNREILFENDFGLLAVGFVTAFVVAMLSISFLLRFIKKYTFTPFGIYRVALALTYLYIMV